ncbi:MAG: glucose-6-phosphate isomerase [Planctomycetota bacterium]
MEGNSDSLRHYLDWRTALDDPFVELDLCSSRLAAEEIDALSPSLEKALGAMRALEGGAIANPSEGRMVGHYWLRAPGLAPDPEISEAIAGTVSGIESFAAGVRDGSVRAPEGECFTDVVLCGIGGSALGPMLLADAMPSPRTRLSVVDNTDPDGIDRVLARIGSLQGAMILVVSKSGGTKETRNAMLEIERQCARENLSFAGRAVAVTLEGSDLHRRSLQESWLRSFPIWEWVGGRTSITSAVGLLPAALLGQDIRGFLAGAAAMDQATREPEIRKNPAAMLAAFWHERGGGRGDRAMVVLPYKDRLLLFGRYLQQLVMESLGKAEDRQGRTVRQGLSVYGNKGSTDQHAFVQQLRDGRDDFFVQFIRVLEDRSGRGDEEIEPGATTGDYLHGFWQGTRKALAQNGRASATITIDRVDERSLGGLIALFERAVGIYAELIDVNAYDQPGVEAGKRAAADVLSLQRRLLDELSPTPRPAREIALAIGADPLESWWVLRHLAANRAGVGAVSVHEPLAARFFRC